MMRKMSSVLAALALLVLLPISAMAAQEQPVAVRSSYMTGDTLYAFAQFNQEAPEELEVSLFINNSKQLESAHPEKLADTGATVHHLLLVDSSSSMLDYSGQLNNFAKSLVENSSRAEITLATVDSQFRIVADKLTNWPQVQSALQGLRYRNDGSDICGGVAAALEYLGEQVYAQGDLAQLVVISDGKPWYADDAQVQSEKMQAANALAAQAMETWPEVIVSTLCLQQWEQSTEAVLSQGRGPHLQSAGFVQAKQAGEELAAFTASLYRLSFPIRGYQDAPVLADVVQLSVENNWYSLGAVRNVQVTPAVLPELPTQAAEETTPQPEDGTKETTGPETETTAPDAETTAPETEPTVLETVPETAEPEEANWMFLVAAAAAVLVVLVVVIVLLQKKVQKAAIRLRVEFLSGAAGNSKKIYYLSKELLIGSGKQCDIVVRDSGVAPANTRIFMQNQMIYIEDLDSPTGTLLNGMRIFSSNRLRSEDEITVGNTTLRVLF